MIDDKYHLYIEWEDETTSMVHTDDGVPLSFATADDAEEFFKAAWYEGCHGTLLVGRDLTEQEMVVDREVVCHST